MRRRAPRSGDREPEHLARGRQAGDPGATRSRLNSLRGKKSLEPAIFKNNGLPLFCSAASFFLWKMDDEASCFCLADRS
jgi:hypothetical protein